jgi:hypothetical protein
MKTFYKIVFLFFLGHSLACENSKLSEVDKNKPDSCQINFVQIKNNNIFIKFLSDSFLFQSNFIKNVKCNDDNALNRSLNYKYCLSAFINQEFDSLILINTNSLGFNNCYIVTPDSAYLRLAISNNLQNKFYSIKSQNKNEKYIKFLVHHIMNSWNYKLYDNLKSYYANNYLEIYIKKESNWFF